MVPPLSIPTFGIGGRLAARADRCVGALPWKADMTARLATSFSFLAFLAAVPAMAREPELAQVPTSRAEMNFSFAPLVKRVSPAVVNIYTKSRVRQQIPPFMRFFGEEFLNRLPQDRVQQALGSGVIVRDTGLIVTNNHVVRGAEEIQVVLADKREFAARVMTIDERYDLAVLKVELGEEKLPALQLRDSDGVEVGDLVLAIGNPFGLQQTVTSGIVSAIARSGGGVTENSFFIQTDAAINPGNSGGALVTMDGKLAGVNTAIFSRSGGSIGIGFATPANIVARMIEVAEQGGRLVRPWIGVDVQKVTADLATSLGMPRPQGVILRAVSVEGPAGKAGLKVGDVLLSVNDHAVDDESALRFRLATVAIGARLALRTTRKGEERTVEIKAMAPPEFPARDERQLTGRNPLQGVRVMNMSPAVADELSLGGSMPGVVVAEVPQNAAGARFLQKGDYIVKVNDTQIDSVATLRSALDEQPQGWTVLVRRGGEVRSFQFRG